MQPSLGGEIRLDALMLSATVVGHADMTLRELVDEEQRSERVLNPLQL